MEIPLNKTIKKLLVFCCLIHFTTKSLAQNYSIQETVNHINRVLNNPKVIISFENNMLVRRDYSTKSGSVGTVEKISISDISDVTVGRNIHSANMPSHARCSSCVFINCLYDSNCTDYTFPNGKRSAMQYLSIVCNSISDSDKIANAIRYIIDKVGKSTANDDPFSTYSVEKKDKGTINIMDLYVGMSKQSVFNTLNTKPMVESIEDGYEVYRVKKNIEDPYFLYFSNGKLTRVDKGVSMYDAIIIID